MEITRETIDYVAALAKLKLTEEEKEQAKEDLSRILEYIGTMNELDTTTLEPFTHVLPLCNVFREDKAEESMDREQILSNAPQTKDGCFVVPKTVE